MRIVANASDALCTLEPSERSVRCY